MEISVFFRVSKNQAVQRCAAAFNAFLFIATFVVFHPREIKVAELEQLDWPIFFASGIECTRSLVVTLKDLPFRYPYRKSVVLENPHV